MTLIAGPQIPPAQDFGAMLKALAESEEYRYKAQEEIDRGIAARHAALGAAVLGLIGASL